MKYGQRAGTGYQQYVENAGPPRDTQDLKSSAPGPRGRQLAVVPRLFGVHEAGQYLGVAADTIRELVSAGHLPTVRLPGTNGSLRKILVDVRDLDRLVETYREAPGE